MTKWGSAQEWGMGVIVSALVERQWAVPLLEHYIGHQVNLQLTTSTIGQLIKAALVAFR